VISSTSLGVCGGRYQQMGYDSGPDGLVIFGIELGVPSQESIDVILGVTP
jgi:hypothetical protein